MKDVIDNIYETTKKAYKESILIDNVKLQDLLFEVLADVKKLESFTEETNKNRIVPVQSTTTRKTTYTQDQVTRITKVQLKLARNEIAEVVAKNEILKISPTFPVQHISSYNKRIQKYLEGKGEYGFAFPSNWAKALLEETSNDSNVIKALKEQQALYLEKDGYINKKLSHVLQTI